jgi:hypothetical protein
VRRLADDLWWNLVAVTLDSARHQPGSGLVAPLRQADLDLSFAASI